MTIIYFLTMRFAELEKVSVEIYVLQKLVIQGLFFLVDIIKVYLCLKIRLCYEKMGTILKKVINTTSYSILDILVVA